MTAAGLLERVGVELGALVDALPESEHKIRLLKALDVLSRELASTFVASGAVRVVEPIALAEPMHSVVASLLHHAHELAQRHFSAMYAGDLYASMETILVHAVERTQFARASIHGAELRIGLARAN